MSNNTQTAPQDGYQFAPSEVQERPRLTATGYVAGFGECKTTSSGDYEMLDIIFKSTRNSRKVFPRLMFRPEMFSIPYFTPALYADYQRYPQFATEQVDENGDVKTNSRGEVKTLGTSYSAVYRLNVMDQGKKGKNGKKDFVKVTPLVAICGGTLEGLSAFAAQCAAKVAEVTSQGREPGDLGFVELTTEEIVDLIKTFHAALPQVEQALIIKQGTDEHGDLKDGYEVDSYQGPFDQGRHDSLTKLCEKSLEGATDKKTGVINVGRVVKQGYRV